MQLVHGKVRSAGQRWLGEFSEALCSTSAATNAIISGCHDMCFCAAHTHRNAAKIGRDNSNGWPSRTARWLEICISIWTVAS